MNSSNALKQGINFSSEAESATTVSQVHLGNSCAIKTVLYTPAKDMLDVVQRSAFEQALPDATWHSGQGTYYSFVCVFKKVLLP